MISWKSTILLADFSVTHMLLAVPWVMPKGPLLRVGTRYSVNCPDEGMRKPNPFTACSLNQTLPPSSIAIFCRPASGVGTGYSTKLPEVLGLSTNMASLLAFRSVNQTRPSAVHRLEGWKGSGRHSAAILPGLAAPLGNGNSKIAPVDVSRNAI